MECMKLYPLFLSNPTRLFSPLSLLYSSLSIHHTLPLSLILFFFSISSFSSLHHCSLPPRPSIILPSSSTSLLCSPQPLHFSFFSLVSFLFLSPSYPLPIPPLHSTPHPFSPLHSLTLLFSLVSFTPVPSLLIPFGQGRKRGRGVDSSNT